MKIKFLVALAAIVTISILSCNWFRNFKKESSNPLVGEWKLHSFHPGKDTSLAAFLISKAIKDSNAISVVFTNDSIFTRSHGSVDVVGYSFDKKTNRLVVEDSTIQTLAFSSHEDSLVSLTTTDSAVFFLQKK